jgi:putative phosphoribosyl transferase
VAETITLRRVAAIVCRGGRPDLVGVALRRVRASTLLIVGAMDCEVIGLNEDALAQLTCEKQLEIIPGAGGTCSSKRSSTRWWPWPATSLSRV